MYTVIITSCNYTLSLEVKRLEIYYVVQKYFGIKEQYSYFWLLNKIGNLTDGKLGPRIREAEKQYIILLSRSAKNNDV